jgi:hypothetical protein
MDELKKAVQFAVRFLTDKEVELMFFRFFHGNSFKTLKKTTNVGSTKTAAKRTARLTEAIKEYVYYYFEQDYFRDLELIRSNLDDEAVVVSEMLFRRMSRHAILRSKKLRISQGRLARMISNIELLCLQHVTLSGFWEVLTSVGKMSRKKV